MCVCVCVFLGCALWAHRVSEGSICPSPLPELAKRELIFMGHRLFFPEAEIQVNSRSIQERSALS